MKRFNGNHVKLVDVLAARQSNEVKLLKSKITELEEEVVHITRKKRNILDMFKGYALFSRKKRADLEEKNQELLQAFDTCIEYINYLHKNGSIGHHWSKLTETQKIFDKYQPINNNIQTNHLQNT